VKILAVQSRLRADCVNLGVNILFRKAEVIANTFKNGLLLQHNRNRYVRSPPVLSN